MLQDLRSMLCQQQFEAPAGALKCHFREGGSTRGQASPLPTLIHVHPGDRIEALELLEQKTWLDLAVGVRCALLH